MIKIYGFLSFKIEWSDKATLIKISNVETCSLHVFLLLLLAFTKFATDSNAAKCLGS
jgi:hypothetical protein